MNGKQLFCLSLIILSVAMGLHWFKNKPKKKKIVSGRPRVALHHEDLQLQDDESIDEVDPKDPKNPDEANPDETNPDETNPDETNPDEGTPAETATASGTENIGENASESVELPPEFDDPIILALNRLARDPFERSPYAKLVEELRAKEDAPEIEEVKKSTQLLQANFTATIKTREELVAVIDSRLYRKGDSFQSREITKIAAEIVSLDSGNELYLIPKVGVEVLIASDGSYTFEDSYRRK